MMKETIRHLMRRLRSEAADTVTTLVIVGLPLILLVTSFVIDGSKNMAVKSEYNNIAQEAAQASVRAQTGDGSLECGQTQQYENTHASTPVYVIRGLKQAQAVASGNWEASGLQQNSGIEPNSDNAQAVTLLVRSYLEKTGRPMGKSVYHDGKLVQADGEKNQNATGSVASANDAKFVNMTKSFIEDPTYSQAENNTLGLRNESGVHTFYDMTKDDAAALKVEGYSSDLGVAGMGGKDKTGYTMNDKDTFTIAVSCSKALSNSGNTSNKTSVSSGNRYTTISVDIRDWAGNFALGMFNSDWNIQRFRMNPRATTSWSASSVN